MAMTDPTAEGRFGDFGGVFVPESLVPACQELDREFRAAWADPAFRTELDGLLRNYSGRPTPVTECTNLSEQLGFLFIDRPAREDLLNPAPILLAIRLDRLRKTRFDPLQLLSGPIQDGDQFPAKVFPLLRLHSLQPADGLPHRRLDHGKEDLRIWPPLPGGTQHSIDPQ